jgi:hypothetical protein
MAKLQAKPRNPCARVSHGEQIAARLRSPTDSGAVMRGSSPSGDRRRRFYERFAARILSLSRMTVPTVRSNSRRSS